MLVEEVEENGHAELYGADLHRIGGAGRHLLTMVNQVLEFSNLGAGRVRVQAEPFALATLLEDVVMHMQSLVARNGNKLVLGTRDEAVHLHSDPHLLRQCLVRLVSNAAQLTRDGQVTLASRSSGGWVAIDVSDTGAGIPADDIDRLFSSFASARSTVDHHVEGLGLELAIAQHLAQLLGGEIKGTSQPGEGSAFTVAIPREIGHRHSAPVAAGSPIPAGWV